MNETEIKNYSEILDSLHSAGIVRTYNSPVGDYTERLVTSKLDLKLQKNDTPGFDALDDREKGIR